MQVNYLPDSGQISYFPGLGFASALGALDTLKQCAEHFGKAFLKDHTAAAALFSSER